MVIYLSSFDSSLPDSPFEFVEKIRVVGDFNFTITLTNVSETICNAVGWIRIAWDFEKQRHVFFSLISFWFERVKESSSWRRFPFHHYRIIKINEIICNDVGWKCIALRFWEIAMSFLFQSLFIRLVAWMWMQDIRMAVDSNFITVVTMINEVIFNHTDWKEIATIS